MSPKVARTVMVAIGIGIVLSFVIRFQMIVLPIKGYLHHPDSAGGMILIRTKLPVVLALVGAVALFCRRSWAPYLIYLSAILSLYHWIVFPLLPLPKLNWNMVNHNILNFLVAGALLWAQISLRKREDLETDDATPESPLSR